MAGRPLERYPKRHVISFRVNDPDMAALQYLADQIKRPGERFNDAIGRVIRDVLLKSAEKSYLAQRERIERGKVSVAVTCEDLDKRRKKYREEFYSGAKWARKKGATESPQRVELASPSVIAVARPEAAHTERADAGEATAKIENLDSPSGSLPQRGSESAGKFE